MSTDRTDASHRLEVLEYAFSSLLDSDEIQARLSAAPGRAWQLRRWEDGSCLSAPGPTAGDPEGRLRLDLAHAADGSYRLTTWYAADGDRAAAAEILWREVLLPIDAYLVEEVAPDLAAGRIEVQRAWSFASHLALDEMRRPLERASRREWMERDSAWYGDYLSLIMREPHDEVTRLRIFEEKERFVLDLRFRSQHPNADATLPGLVRWLSEVLLPAVDAHDVADDEGYD